MNRWKVDPGRQGGAGIEYVSADTLTFIGVWALFYNYKDSVGTLVKAISCPSGTVIIKEQ